MKINSKKSGVIFHKKRKSAKNQRAGNVKGIPICQKYKYLGVIINETLSTDDHNQQIENNT